MKLQKRFERRGTVLVLVLGALALISLVTILYVTLGQGDRRAAAVTTQRDNVGVVVDRVKNHITQTIADDVFATFVDGYESRGAGQSPSPRPVLARRGLTFPYVDPWRRSALAKTTTGAPPAQLERRFDVTGSYSDWLDPNRPGASTGVDPRLPYVPWLASTTPSWLRQGEFPNLQRPRQGWLYHRDWMQISNFAPDGRLTNLWNLAPIVNGERVSAWDASSELPVEGQELRGVPPAPFFDAATNRVVANINYGKTLMEPNPPDLSSGATLASNPQSQRVEDPQRRFDPLIDPNAPSVQLLQADPNVPAHWTMYQMNMIRSMRDAAYGPDRPEYLPYQWADTDGDGVPDARWFELVDATDPNKIISLLPPDDRYRWFIAARAIDLSSIVNVNTAGDFRSPPKPQRRDLTPIAGAPSPPPPPRWQVSQASTVGASPADIDLRRLLTMSDVYFQYFYPSGGAGAGPQAGSGGYNARGGYSELAPTPTLSAAPEWQAEDYRDEQGSFNGAYNALRAWQAGEFAYNALQLVRRQNRPFVPAPDADVRTYPDPYILRSSPFPAYNAAADEYAGAPVLASDQRVQQFGAVLRRRDGSSFTEAELDQNGAATSLSPAVRSATLFGADEMLELLTYRTKNNPDSTSRLELVVDGRFLEPNVSAAQRRPGLGVARSNRSLALEGQVDAREGSGLGNGLIDDTAMARIMLDVRQYLTTFSGARSLRSGPIISGSEGTAARLGALDPEVDAKLGVGETLDLATRNFFLGSGTPNANDVLAPLPRDPSRLFRGYADALLPHSGREGAWDIDFPYPTTTTLVTGLVPTGEAMATMHYGGNRGRIARWGPELALRLSAHLTANAIDAWDVDVERDDVRGTVAQNLPYWRWNGTIDRHTPTALTVLIDASKRNQVRFPINAPAQDANRFPFAALVPYPAGAPVLPSQWNTRPGLLDLDTNPGVTTVPDAEPVIVRKRLLDSTLPGDPVPPPVIAPRTAARAGAVTVFGIEPQPVLVQAASFVFYRIPTAEGDVNLTSDLGGQILAFQISNPFDEDIVLMDGDRAQAPVNPSEPDPRRFKYPVRAGHWPEYYIEYNGRRFGLMEFDRASNQYVSATLLAGETRTFYALSVDVAQFNGTQWFNNRLNEIINTQLTLSKFGQTATEQTVAPAEIHLLNAPNSTGADSSRTFVLQTPGATAVDFFSHPDTTIRADIGLRREAQGNVYLWRTLRARPADPALTANTEFVDRRLNRLATDQLVEVLRDPALDEFEADLNPGVRARFDQMTLDRRLQGVELDASGGSLSVRMTNVPNSNTTGEPGGQNTYVPQYFGMAGAIRRRHGDPAPGLGNGGGLATFLNPATWTPAQREWRLRQVGAVPGFMIGGKQDPLAVRVDSSSAAPDNDKQWYPRNWWVSTGGNPARLAPTAAAVTIPDVRNVAIIGRRGRPPEDCLQYVTTGLVLIADQAVFTDTIATTSLHTKLKLIPQAWFNDIPTGLSAQEAPDEQLGANLDGRSFRQAVGELVHFGDQTIKAATRSYPTQRAFLDAMPQWILDLNISAGAKEQLWFQVRDNVIRNVMEAEGRSPKRVGISGATAITQEVELLDVARLQDLLSVMAIGPEYDPPVRGATTANDPSLLPDEVPSQADPVPARARWITLPNALAMALNYSSPPDADAGNPQNPGDVSNTAELDFTIYARLGDPRLAPTAANPLPGNNTAVYGSPVAPPTGSARPIAAALDRGMLLMERYAPFEDRNLNGVFDRATSVVDSKRWPGIPLAMAISNSFDERATRATALTQSTPGVINLNTAPPAVLKLIPMLSPTTERLPTNATAAIPSGEYVWGDPTGNPSDLSGYAWMGKAFGVNPAQPLQPNPKPVRFIGMGTDLAAGLQAYRDQMNVYTRGKPEFPNARIPRQPESLVRFGTRAPVQSQAQLSSNPLIAPNLEGPIVPEAALNNSGAPRPWSGRFDTTRIMAIREQPGLVSPMEIMAIIDRSPDSGGQYFFSRDNPFGRRHLPSPTSFFFNDARIQDSENTADRWMANSDTNSGPLADGYLGLTSSAHPNPINRPASLNASVDWPQEVPAGVGDSPLERFLPAAGAIRTTTTRSDVFAVWFIVHGYQKSDTENLRPSDPLRPSIAKRFVMVVDRSNVTRKGQEPKILLFEELPLVDPMQN